MANTRIVLYLDENKKVQTQTLKQSIVGDYLYYRATFPRKAFILGVYEQQSAGLEGSYNAWVILSPLGFSPLETYFFGSYSKDYSLISENDMRPAQSIYEDKLDVV